LGRVAIKNWLLAGIAVAGIVLRLLGVHELLVLFGAAVVAGVPRWMLRHAHACGIALPLGVFLPAASAGVASASGFSLTTLFLFFLKVGSVLFGSGYVLLAFLRADLVQRWGWLTESQLFDAVAVGQVTPGPLFTTATFIGYLLAGPAGAFLATLGIFLPAFFFVAVSGPLVPRLRQSPAAGAALDAINAAALALMATVSLELARAAFVDGYTVAIATIGAWMLLRFRVNAAWLVLGGSLAGLGVRWGTL
jgi:chromate transporter